MKKLVSNLSIATLIVGLAFSFGSCESEYECECTTDGPNVSGSTTTKDEFSDESEAEDWCNGQESTSETPAGTVETTCELTEL